MTKIEYFKALAGMRNSASALHFAQCADNGSALVTNNIDNNSSELFA